MQSLVSFTPTNVSHTTLKLSKFNCHLFFVKPMLWEPCQQTIICVNCLGGFSLLHPPVLTDLTKTSCVAGEQQRVTTRGCLEMCSLRDLGSCWAGVLSSRFTGRLSHSYLLAPTVSESWLDLLAAAADDPLHHSLQSELHLSTFMRLSDQLLKPIPWNLWRNPSGSEDSSASQQHFPFRFWQIVPKVVGWIGSGSSKMSNMSLQCSCRVKDQW